MITQTLSLSSKIKRILGLVVCFIVPFLWYHDFYIVSHMVFVLYLAFVFYDSEHYNIRFIVGLLAFADMLLLSSEFLVKFVTRTLVELNDFSYEIIFLTFTELFVSLLAIFAILQRGRLVDAFRNLTNTGQKYRLIGIEWLLLISFAAIALLQLINFIILFPHILSITDIDSLYDFYTDPETVNIHDFYFNAFLTFVALQLFSLQSYNYKRFRKEWRFSS